MSLWARAHTPLPFSFHDWISTLSPNFKRQGEKVKWDFLVWRLNIVVGKQKAYHFCWYFLTPLLRCKVVFEDCIWHIARYLFIAAALGPQVPFGSYLLFHCSVRNCLSSPCECEIVWRGPVPGLQCLAQLQEAAVRFALGQVEPHGHQPPGCWSVNEHNFSLALFSLYSIICLDLVTWCLKHLDCHQNLISHPMDSELGFNKEPAPLFHCLNVSVVDCRLLSQMKGILWLKILISFIYLREQTWGLSSEDMYCLNLHIIIWDDLVNVDS